MERLTARDEFGNADIIGVDSGDLQLNLEYDEFTKVTDALNKLASYEDAEEQGLLLRLPCKVGDTVYQVTRNFVSEYKIKSFIQYDNGNIWYDWECTKGIYINVIGFPIDSIGKTVFLTGEEAEEKLAEMEKKHGVKI